MENTKHIKVGWGTSYLKNPYKAAKEAAKRALQQCKKPDLSIVYTNSNFDQKEFLKGVNEILGNQWVGISTDKIFVTDEGYDPNITISILSLSSKYMHFSVSVAEKYLNNPQKAARYAIQKAVKTMHADRYVDAYMQFTRTKIKDYGTIIRHPPYFILTFIRGLTMDKGVTTSGREIEFVSGLLDYTGPHIPMFGGSASSSLEEYLTGHSTNVQFAHGKMFKDAAVVVFCICNLYFTNLVQHGYELTKDFATITKIDKSGYDILEINSREPVAEYCRIIGVTKKQFLKDPYSYSVSRPFSVVSEDGTTIVKEAVVNPDQKTLHSNFKLYKNAILNVMNIDKKDTTHTMKNSVDKMLTMSESKKPAVALFCSCSGRRPLVKNLEKQDVKNFEKKYKKLPYFGFYSFGEVGSTKTTSAQSHSQTVTSLIIYDQLLTE